MGSAHAAENITADVTDAAPIMGDGVSDNGSGEVEDEGISFNVSDESAYIKKSYFNVQLVDAGGAGIENKTIFFKINGTIYNNTTDSNGNAKLKLGFEKGAYKISYAFNGTGQGKITASKNILIIKKTTSRIGLKYNAPYSMFKNTYSLKLKVNGLALPNRHVTIRIDGKSYDKVSDKNGKVVFAIKLAQGIHRIEYSYAGEKNIDAANGSSSVNVVLMPVSIKKANSITYRAKLSSPFKIKLTDAFGNAVSNKEVKVKLNNNVYTVKTNKKGVASLSIKLAKGSYKLKVVSPKTTAYAKASKSFRIQVKAANIRGNGLWLFASDMKNVNFTQLKQNGVKHVLLNAYAIDKYGKKFVESYIRTAHDYGVKIHLWVQVFYYSGWHYPIKNGQIDYDMISSKISQVKKYAKIKGVDGIHFDYLRFSGDAYKYSKAVDAVNYFTKHATKAVHNINPKIIVSAAVMPEPSSMKYYYAQDIPTLSKYLDVIVPMVYKGNYNAGTNWIKSVTQTFVKQSNGAKIWTGLQSYRSDSDTTKIPAGELKKDAEAAISAGATGVIVFRWGIMNFINFNEL